MTDDQTAEPQLGMHVVTSEDMPPGKIMAIDLANLHVVAVCKHCEKLIKLFPIPSPWLTNVLEELMVWWHVDEDQDKTTQICCVQESAASTSFNFAEPD